MADENEVNLADARRLARIVAGHNGKMIFTGPETLALLDRIDGLAADNQLQSGRLYENRGELSTMQREIDRVTAERDRLKKELAEARFRPLGDNHHNAALCPYCNPTLNAQTAAHLSVSKGDENAK